MSEEQMRDGFERFIRGEYPYLRPNLDVCSFFYEKWAVWKAALATQPQAPQGAAPLTVADIVKTPGIAGLKAAPLLSKLKAAGFDVTLNQPLAPDHIAALIVMPTACGNDRPQGAVTREQLEAAFEAEIAKVSHVAYDSNEICRHFFNNIRTALCAAPETPEGKK